MNQIDGQSSPNAQVVVKQLPPSELHVGFRNMDRMRAFVEEIRTLKEEWKEDMTPMFSVRRISSGNLAVSAQANAIFFLP